MESGNGGELTLLSNDLAMAGIANMVYLALFGGDSDWWGNNFLPNEQHFTSETETMLRSVALNSSGRQKIEQAVLNDLDFLREVPGTTITVAVSIVSVDRITISIRINGEQIFFLWDGELQKVFRGQKNVDFLLDENYQIILTEDGVSYFIAE